MRKVEIIGKFFDNHSLSIINRKLAIGLSKENDIDVYINVLDSYDPQYNVSSTELKEIKKLTAKAMTEEPDIQIRHTYPPIWRWPVSDKTRVFQIQPWEYRKLPFEWQYKFETFVDKVITPSTWTANIYKEAGLRPDKVEVIPNGYDTKYFNTKNKNLSDKYTFVFVGNAQWRKGLDILLQIWSQVFKKEDNAKLIIKDNPAVYGDYQVVPQLVKLQYDTGCAEIEYIGNQLSEIDMSRIYKSSHVLVHPYRGEGFGMHVQEAMACGCFPLVTGDGPTDEFVRDDLCRIPPKAVVVKADDPKYMMMKPGDSLTTMGGHAIAAEPDIHDLAGKMRACYDRNITGRDYSRELFTWENVIERYATLINSVDMSEPTARILAQGWRTA